MLNLPQKTFNRIKNKLLRQKREIESGIKSLEQDDPLKSGGLAETSEPGTESWLADVHARALALKENLRQLLIKTQQSLTRLRSGRYGRCERCGKLIEAQRLEVIPTATLCLSCSRKK